MGNPYADLVILTFWDGLQEFTLQSTLSDQAVISTVSSVLNFILRSWNKNYVLARARDLAKAKWFVFLRQIHMGCNVCACGGAWSQVKGNMLSCSRSRGWLNHFESHITKQPQVENR